MVRSKTAEPREEGLPGLLCAHRGGRCDHMPLQALSAVAVSSPDFGVQATTVAAMARAAKKAAIGLSMDMGFSSDSCGERLANRGIDLSRRPGACSGAGQYGQSRLDCQAFRLVLRASPGVPIASLAALWTPWRRRAWTYAWTGSIAVAFLVQVVGARGAVAPDGGRVGGDLPGFLGAARIVAEGRAQELYSPVAQAVAQVGLLPPGTEGHVRFAYPPFVVIPYLPLVGLPLAGAVAVHALVSAGCIAAAIGVLARLLPRVATNRGPAIAAALGFYPLVRAVYGGQNTAVSLLLAAMGLSAVARRSKGAEGMAWGLWAFKPQLGGALLALRGARRPRVLFAGGVVAAAWWGLGAAVAGPGWVGAWWSQGVVPFLAEDRAVDLPNAIGVHERAAAALGDAGGAAVWGLAALGVAALWRCMGDPVVRTALLIAVVPALAPHGLYYDAGLVIPALCVVADRRGLASAPALVALGALSWSAVVLPPGAVGLALVVGAVLLLARASVAERHGVPPERDGD